MNILALDLGTSTGFCHTIVDGHCAGTWVLATDKEVKQWHRDRTARRKDPRIARLYAKLLVVRPCPDVVVFEDVQFQSYATRISSDNRLAIALGTVGGNSTRAGFVTYDLAVVRPRGFRALLRQGPATEPATLIGTALSWDAHVVGFLPGSHVVLTALPDSSSDGHGWDLFLWDLDANEMSHVTHLENGWAAADISPDGRSVLLIREGTIEFLPLAELRR